MMSLLPVGSGLGEDLVTIGRGDVETGICLGCEIGHYLSRNETKQRWNGNELVSETEGLFCSKCLKGTYSNNNHSVECDLCTPGQFQDEEGASFCEPCRSGYAMPTAGSSLCRACVAGTYQNNTGQSRCDLCESGTYSSLHGATNCSVCEIGTYSVQGSSKCLPCPGGSFGVDIDGFIKCQACPNIGRFGADGRPLEEFIDFVRTPIMQLQTSDVVGARSEEEAECLPLDSNRIKCSIYAEENCEEGQFLSLCGNNRGGVCVNCTSLCRFTVSHQCTFRNPGCCALHGQTCTAPVNVSFDSEPSPVLNFTQQEWVDFYKLCLGGYYKVVAENSTDCVRCPPGTSSSLIGAMYVSECIPCPRHTYSSHAKNNSLTCTSCPSNTFSPAISQLGATSVHEACQACPAGKEYKRVRKGYTEDDTCSLCAIGKYSSEGGSCTSCYLGSTTSQEGSPSIESCACTGAYEFATSTSCQLRTVYQCNVMQTQPDPYTPCTWCRAKERASSDGTQCVPLQSSDIYPSPAPECSRHQVTQIERIERHPGHIQYTVFCVDCPPIDSTDSSQLMFASRSAVATTLECAVGCRPGTYTQFIEAGDSFSNAGNNYNNTGRNYRCPSCAEGQITTLFSELVCTLCPPGSLSEAEDFSTMCIPSPAGFEQPLPGGVNATACSPGSSAPSGSSSCALCEVGTYAGEAASASCEACPSGLVSLSPGATVCHMCERGEETFNASRCIPCPYGTYAHETTPGICQLCPADTLGNVEGALQIDICEQCPAGFSTFGQTGVTSTSNTEGLIHTGCTACPLGHYQRTSDNVCVECSAGYFADQRGLQDACEICPLGTYSTEVARTTACTPCEQGFYSNTLAAPYCFPCDSGTYTLSPGTADCLMCAAGSYEEENICGPCANGTFSDQSAVTTCTACAPGEVTFQPGSIECVPCEMGFYEVDNVCNPCPHGTSSNTESAISCIPCASGDVTIQEGSTECIPCEKGFFEVENVCELCPHGTSSNIESASSCIPCERGYITPMPASTECIPCLPGSYEENNTCVSCFQGTYTDVSAAISCLACEDGYVAMGSGNTECSPCTMGSFQEGTTCSPCAPGTYSDHDAATSCIPCAAGSIAEGVNNTECALCPVGHYEFENVCVACAGGTFSNETGVIECETCPSGEVTLRDGSIGCVPCVAGARAENNMCVPCESGSISTEESSTECSLCANGTMTLSSGSTECTECGLGEYENNNECLWCPDGTASNVMAASECQQCPDGFISIGQMTSCGACPAGYYVSDFNCVLCEEDTVSETGSMVCTSCPAVPSNASILLLVQDNTCVCPQDFFMDAQNNMQCEPCAFGTSTFGAVNESTCTIVTTTSTPQPTTTSTTPSPTTTTTSPSPTTTTTSPSPTTTTTTPSLTTTTTSTLSTTTTPHPTTHPLTTAETTTTDTDTSTPIPASTIPESTIPESTVPESTIPESTVPGSTIPVVTTSPPPGPSATPAPTPQPSPGPSPEEPMPVEKPFLELRLAFSLPFASDFENLSVGILKMVAKVAQIESKWVSLAKMTTSPPQNRRRLLAEMVYTTYNVQPPRPRTASSRTADQIASSLTSSNIDAALREDPVLSQYITGFTVTKVSVDSVAEESIFANAEILVAVIAGSISLATCCCMILACVRCRIRNRRRRATNLDEGFAPLNNPPLPAARSFPQHRSQLSHSVFNASAMSTEVPLLFPVSLAISPERHTPRSVFPKTKQENESVLSSTFPFARSQNAATNQVSKRYIDVRMDDSNLF